MKDALALALACITATLIMLAGAAALMASLSSCDVLSNVGKALHNNFSSEQCK